MLTVAEPATTSPRPAADTLDAALHDLAEALPQLPFGTPIVPITVALDEPCEGCPARWSDLAPADAVAIVAWRAAGSRWTHRTPSCAGCLGDLAAERPAAAEVWVETSFAGAS